MRFDTVSDRCPRSRPPADDGWLWSGDNELGPQCDRERDDRQHVSGGRDERDQHRRNDERSDEPDQQRRVDDSEYVYHIVDHGLDDGDADNEDLEHEDSAEHGVVGLERWVERSRRKLEQRRIER